IAVSPDGQTVFATGTAASEDYLTVAQDAVTGELLWSRTYDPSGGTDQVRDIGLSPDGTTVFVTGLSDGVGTSADFATLAYDAGTGGDRWTARYDVAGGFDEPRALAIGPGGTRVYVTGDSSA